jgi:hypothetical protein
VSRALVDRPSRQLDVDGRPVDVRVRESPTARTTRILLGAQRPLEIIVPADTAAEEINAALLARRGWIAEKLKQVEAERERPFALGLQRSGVAWLRGKPVRVETVIGDRVTASEQDGVLVLRGPGNEGRQEGLARWYRRAAKAAISEATESEAARLGLEFGAVAVRDQRTRWGSCSPGRNLSFNWRLVLAPAVVLRYVVIHELCHLRVPNHSRQFWRQLEAAVPGWQEQAAWLSEHGAELRAYRPEL